MKIRLKLILFNTIFILSIVSCYSKNRFHLNSKLGHQKVVINGKLYTIDSVGSKIRTNYPDFDTLVFKPEHWEFKTIIICNFKPDSTYSITGACCGSLDIVPQSKLKCDSLNYWGAEDFTKIQDQLMDKPFISIKTKSPTKDSIFAWHADAACNTKHNVINTNPWQLGVPPKCFYWSNITTIQFFKIDDKLPQHEDTHLEEFLGIKNIVELASISFRLFDNQRFLLIYDDIKNTVKLEYE